MWAGIVPTLANQFAARLSGLTMYPFHRTSVRVKGVDSRTPESREFLKSVQVFRIHSFIEEMLSWVNDGKGISTPTLGVAPQAKRIR